MTQANNFIDQFLIAMPLLKDPHFARSVTYICEHNAEGALGITINQPMELRLGQMLEELGLTISDPNLNCIPVYTGGPVHTDRGFILHNTTTEWESTLQIADNMSLTTSLDILEAIAAGCGPSQALVALGYAGWDGDQLEQEILTNSWLNIKADYDIIFNTENEQRWPQAATKLGIDLNHLYLNAGHA